MREIPNSCAKPRVEGTRWPGLEPPFDDGALEPA